jgi:protoheme IX farnesyltransferase
VLLANAHRLLARIRRDENGKPMSLFHLSNSYLAFVFLAIAVDTLVR